MVVVAEGWPSSLVALESLGLHVEGAYFPPKLHRYFNGKLALRPTSAFDFMNHGDAVVTLAGSTDFLRRVWPRLHCSSSLIVELKVPLRGASLREGKSARQRGCALFGELGLRTVVWKDEQCGGATDARFVLGFGHGIASGAVPSAPLTLSRALRHYLSPTARQRGDKVLPLPENQVMDALPPQRRPLLHDGALLPQGLFSSRSPDSLVICPSVYHGGRRVARRLSLGEKLRLHQLPLRMDAVLLEAFEGGHRGRSSNPLPFEDSPPPEWYAHIFRWMGELEYGGGFDGKIVPVERQGGRDTGGDGMETGGKGNNGEGADGPSPASEGTTPVIATSSLDFPSPARVGQSVDGAPASEAGTPPVFSKPLPQRA